MSNHEESVSKSEMAVFWKCRICEKANSAPPLFRDFLPFIHHLIEHRMPPKEHGLDSNKVVYSAIWDQGEYRLATRGVAKDYLLPIADWLGDALESSPELNMMVSNDVHTPDQLVALVKRLPDQFAEQRGYLLEHVETLNDVGGDPDWPRRAGSQARFVADSMAGAHWGYKASSSHEFIRKRRPKQKTAKGSAVRLRREGRWWEVEPGDPDQEEG